MGTLSYVFTATFISVVTYLVDLDPVLKVNETMWRVRHTWLFFHRQFYVRRRRTSYIISNPRELVAKRWG